MYGANKKGQPPLKAIVVLLVRVEGLEPSRREAPDPKSGASAIPPHSQVPFYSTMLPSYWSNKNRGWWFFTIITLGIYGFWLFNKMTAWRVKHTHFVGN
jgi:hypothetical protein